MTSKWRKNNPIRKTFKDIGFNFEIQTNLKKLAFLGITLSLKIALVIHSKNGKLFYIRLLSNHPPQIIKLFSNYILEKLSNILLIHQQQIHPQQIGKSKKQQAKHNIV